MKSNAPENLYFFEGETILSARSKKIEDANIEYVRKDVFIEKACDYLMEYEFNDSPTIADRRKRVDEFINYMENKA